MKSFECTTEHIFECFDRCHRDCWYTCRDQLTDLGKNNTIYSNLNSWIWIRKNAGVIRLRPRRSYRVRILVYKCEHSMCPSRRISSYLQARIFSGRAQQMRCQTLFRSYIHVVDMTSEFYYRGDDSGDLGDTVSLQGSYEAESPMLSSVDVVNTRLCVRKIIGWAHRAPYESSPECLFES